MIFTKIPWKYTNFVGQNTNQANNVQNEVSNKHHNQDQIIENQTQPQLQQTVPKVKPKAQPRKMDLSEYDTANDEIISASNAPESAVTSDERVCSFIHSFIQYQIKLPSLNLMNVGRASSANKQTKKIISRLTKN